MVRVQDQKQRQGADDILVKRMVKGFYVAIDKTFRWNNRTWYKTTKGLVAPADRFRFFARDLERPLRSMDALCSGLASGPGRC